MDVLRRLLEHTFQQQLLKSILVIQRPSLESRGSGGKSVSSITVMRMDVGPDLLQRKSNIRLSQFESSSLEKAQIERIGHA